jgi:hypothetical protein
MLRLINSTHGRQIVQTSFSNFPMVYERNRRNFREGISQTQGASVFETNRSEVKAAKFQEVKNCFVTAMQSMSSGKQVCSYVLHDMGVHPYHKGGYRSYLKCQGFYFFVTKLGNGYYMPTYVECTRRPGKPLRVLINGSFKSNHQKNSIDNRYFPEERLIAKFMKETSESEHNSLSFMKLSRT